MKKPVLDVYAGVGSADAQIAAATEHRPDVCLIDLSMPGDRDPRGFPRYANVAGHRGRRTQTVSADSVDLLPRPSARVRSATSLKDMNPDGLAAALMAAVAGEAVISASTHGSAGRGGPTPPRSRPHTLDSEGQQVELTPRESEVLVMLADDLSTAEIAARLELDQVTVRRHVSSVVRKLGVSSRKRRLFACSTTQSRSADPRADRLRMRLRAFDVLGLNAFSRNLTHSPGRTSRFRLGHGRTGGGDLMDGGSGVAIEGVGRVGSGRPR